MTRITSHRSATPAHITGHRYITYGTTVPGTLIDRVVSIGESPLKCVFRKSGIDGHADSIRLGLLLNSRNYLNHNSGSEAVKSEANLGARHFEIERITAD